MYVFGEKIHYAKEIVKGTLYISVAQNSASKETQKSTKSY